MLSRLLEMETDMPPWFNRWESPLGASKEFWFYFTMASLLVKKCLELIPGKKSQIFLGLFLDYFTIVFYI